MILKKLLLANEVFVKQRKQKHEKKQSMQCCDICFQVCNKQDAQIIEFEFQAYEKACDCNRTHKK